MLYTIGGSSYVNIAYYLQIRSPGAHIQNLTLKDGRVLQVRTDSVIADIPYPGSTTPQKLDNIPSLIAQIEVLNTRYPQYSNVLTSVSNAWEKVLSDEQQRAAVHLQAQKEEDERQNQNQIAEQRKQELATREEQARERMREEQQKLLIQSGINTLSTLAASVSWAIESNNLNRKSLIEHSGIDEKNWDQWVEKSLSSQTSEQTIDLSSSDLANDKRYILSFSKVFSIVDMANQNRHSNALLELKTIIDFNGSEDALRSGANKLFAPLTEALEKKIAESDALRAQAQELFNDKKYSAAGDLFGKATIIDRRDSDDDTLKKCKEFEQKHALETLGI